MGIVCVLALSSCVKRVDENSDNSGRPQVQLGVFHPQNWPMLDRKAAVQDPVFERRLDGIISKMTLRQKIGQVIQVDARFIEPKDLNTYPIGSIITGAEDVSFDLMSLEQSQLRADGFYRQALMADLQGGPFIPPLRLIDMSVAYDQLDIATRFPNHMALGAADDVALITQIGAAQRHQLREFGFDWIIASTLNMPSGPKSALSSQVFSQDVKRAARNGAAMLKGVSSAKLDADSHILVGAKYVLGDDNKGKDLRVSESVLIARHAPLISAGLEQNPDALMISAQTWHGSALIGNASFLKDILRSRFGYEGVIMGARDAHASLDGCTDANCPVALDAGLDLLGAGENWKALFDGLYRAAISRELDRERLEAAARRVVSMKLSAGLFDSGAPALRRGQDEKHHLQAGFRAELAQDAVRRSLVLLKNQGAVLPLSPLDHVLLAGDSAPILTGAAKAIEAAGGRLTVSEKGSYSDKPNVAIMIIHDDDRQAQRVRLDSVKTLRASGIPVVTILLSGNPVYISEFIESSNGFIAAWQPGTESGAISDVIFAARSGLIAHDFIGRLPAPWPRHVDQDFSSSGGNQDALFPIGYGLSYR